MTALKRGGLRRGQGRKTPDSPSGELKVYSVRLDPKTVKTLKEVGGGNVSAGIRMLVAAQKPPSH